MKRLFFLSLFVILGISCAAQNPQPMPYNLKVPTAPMRPNATQVWAVDAGNTFAKINISDLGFTGEGSTATTDAGQLSSGILPDARLSDNVLRSDRNDQSLEGDFSVNGTLYSDAYLLGYDYSIFSVADGQSGAQAYWAMQLSGNTQQAGQAYDAKTVGLGKSAYHIVAPMTSPTAAGFAVLGAPNQRGNFVEYTKWEDRENPDKRGNAFRITYDGKMYVNDQYVDVSAIGTGGSGSGTIPSASEVTTNRNLNAGDVGNIIRCTNSAQITIPVDFSDMQINQQINLEAHNGAALSIVAPSGVTLNFQDGRTAVLASRVENVTLGVLVKIDENKYIITGQ